MNKKSKWMLLGLSTALALSMTVPAANANTLSELEQKKQEAEQKKTELKAGITEKADAINKNQSALEKIEEKLQQLNNQIKETEAKIVSIQAEVEQTKVEIEKLQLSIAELERKIAERTALLQERARAIQLSGGSVDYIDVLMSANSFVDFIDRFSAVNILIEADREIMRQQADDKKKLAEQKETVEVKLAEQEARRSELVLLQASLDGQKKEQIALVKELEAEQKRLESEKSALEDHFEEEIKISADLEKQIADEQARLAELARKAEEERLRKLAAEAEKERKAAEKQKAEEERAAANRKAQAAVTPQRSSYPAPSAYKAPVVEKKAAVEAEGAMFIMPTSGRYTSGFGGRDIGEGAESHLGQDIANVTGTSITAAASGYVSFAGVMGGYGNVVILTHSIKGQTYATVYAHMSSINVTAGQAVSQGQQVGGMGNTGRSTGTHLHFEIHVGPWNGARSNAVNPAGYLGI